MVITTAKRYLSGFHLEIPLQMKQDLNICSQGGFLRADVSAIVRLKNLQVDLMDVLAVYLAGQSSCGWDV